MFFRMIFVVLIFFVFFNGIALYKLLSSYFEVNKILYWIIYSISQIIFLIMYMISNRYTQIIGGFWIGLVSYYLMFNIIFSCIMLFFPKESDVRKYLLLSSLICTFIVTIYGYVNANIIRITEYELTTKKLDKDYNIVLISDLHLGNMLGKNLVDKIIPKINKLKPDILLIAGDIFNGDFSSVNNLDYIADEIKNIKTTYGIYAVFGNHDSLKDYDDIMDFFDKANIKFLEDTTVSFENITLIGRKDKSPIGSRGVTRESVLDLMRDVNKDNYLVILDHQPFDVDNIVNAGIDLEVSGHTHKGQIFPGSIVTNIMYKLDYGYEKYNNTDVIVSSGVGYWGPPLRVNSVSEIVSIKVKKEG